ncbi:acyl-CoA dehydrogenase family protein [Rhodococcus sp. NCIMB 12038]|jgi:cyclohexanecarboxyl-CoA dehydrogenase|uniref:acyl-CoA dehydrogenase family protein n=1 Tax=Rhodococcus sp. NCIMB 12038 TaxID=933800 RepID=UPI000B3D18CE|nr:acyl-CoA dehydrogenase family protein [Rhodococcus sp. NCIMB 12038]OUS91611.1 cyclohexanecarboxyl-CoA dehydrogenase [Rhodococcus sp. NCIMB 12038]
MDFALSEAQQALVDAAKRFSRTELAPFYRRREQDGRLDRDVLQRMGELGFFGVELAEEYGGLELDAVTAGLVLEALCADDMNFGYVAVTVSLLGQILQKHGIPDAVRPWITGMVSGRLLPAIALTEPRGGSDAAHLTLSARRDGDHYVLNGEKTSISMATQADFCVLFARTGTKEAAAKGISAFLVPLDNSNIKKTGFDDHGTISVGRGSLFFDDVLVPAEYLLGEANKGFVQVMQGFDYSRALLGILCLAVARRSLDDAWEHARTREAFGKPLASFQGVTFPLAEAETHLLGARLVCLYTLWLKDQALPHTAEAAMCKWWGPKLAYDIVNTCLLTHGHGGYSKELPLEQRMRDLLGLQIGDGTAQIMKILIARSHVGHLAA